LPRSLGDGREATLRPILVIGLTARTGTNYLGRLLAAHRDCTRPTSLYEDYMVFGLRHLNKFIKQASRHWQPSSVGEKQKQLRTLLGSSMTKFLLEDAKDQSKRPVFKTPTVWGLAHAHQFLPRCDVIVLTRNGPDVVESGMRSFGWQFERASCFWGDAARYLVQTCEDRRRNDTPPLTIIRYEDLVAQPAATLRSIFGAVGRCRPVRFRPPGELPAVWFLDRARRVGGRNLGVGSKTGGIRSAEAGAALVGGRLSSF
jgi:Sulfotransferase family